MRPRLSSTAALAAAVLLLAGLSGCGTLHSWVQGGTGHAPTAGATVSVPLGK